MRELVVILGFLFLNAKINRLHGKALSDVGDFADIADDLQDEFFPDNDTGIAGSSFKTVDQVTNAAWANRQTGREKIVNESLYWGVGNRARAYTDHLDYYNAQHPRNPIKYLSNDRNAVFGSFASKEDMRRFVNWMHQSDGYLEVIS